MQTDQADWPLVSLEDITSKIGSGATPRGGKQSYKEEGISLIRSLNVYDFEFAYNDLAFIDEEQAADLSNVEVQQNDVLINITGASVARCCLVPEEVLPARVNQHVAIVRALADKADARYVQYCLSSPRRKDHLLSIASGGATRKALTKSTLQDYQIPLPPLPVQQRVAGILSAYDDLIANNARRIELLEEMTQAVYREWFVEMHFPGYADAEMRETEALGAVPREWEAVPFTEIAEVLSGGTPKTTVDEYWEGTIPFFSPKDMPDSFYVTEDTSRHITEEGIANCSSEIYPKETVFITARGTVGRVVMPATGMAMNQSCYALRGKEGIDQLFVFFAIRSRVRQLKQRAHGAVFDTIIMSTFEDIYVAKPPQALVERFVSVVRPLFGQMLNLTRRNATLRRTRDLLLPRLVNGKVAVEAKGKAVAEAHA